MYTKGQIEIMLNNLVILVDSREKKNDHIISYLDKREVKYEVKKLDFGDYSCFIPVIENVNNEIIDFSTILTIERKQNFSELAINFTKGRDRFVRELERKKGSMCLLIEEPYSKLIEHKYRSNYNPVSFNATLMSYTHRYNVSTVFGDKKSSPIFILTWLKYGVRDYLLKGGSINGI